MTDDPFGTATLRSSTLDAWAASPTRLAEDAAAEADLVTVGYQDRLLTELAANAADAAARGAADEFSEDGYYGDQETLLDPGAVDRAARESLARQVPSSRIEAWEVTRATPTGDGQQATVRVTSRPRFAVTGLVRGYVPGGATITVESTARGGSGQAP